ncbi:MAG: hypothetical protein IJX43_02390, partial [Alphaproteobacteria bacterium]|nr:hypothetical protein [Alphaproteobacteria bacterium]
LYFSSEAKNICKHLQKNLKKTDGLDGVLKNIGGARDKLKAAREFKSEKHLAWFEKTLNALKNDPKLSKVWAGALKDGTHMQALVKEMIIRAVKEGKKDECKTALELISVLHYDYTTSKIMETLGKENLTIFSDGKLSWNKNEGMKLVTTALDKSIKTAFMGIGYGITMVGNAIKMSNRKIKNYSGDKNFKKEHDAYLDQQANDKQALVDLLANERTQRTTTQATVDGIRAGRTYNVAKTDIENTISTTEAIIATDVQALEQALIQTANSVNGGGPWTPIANAAEYDAIETFIKSVGTGTLATKPTLTGTGAALQTHLDNIETQHSALTTQRQKLDDLVNGTELLTQLDEQITRHQDEVSNWDANHMDAMEELALYWNMLETGRNTKTGPMYNWVRNLNKNNAQKRFSGQVSGLISAYNQSHSIAA